MSQKIFNFKGYYRNVFPKESPFYVTHQGLMDHVKKNLVERGWLVKDVNVQEVFLVDCVTAKANIPEAKRLSGEIKSAEKASYLALKAVDGKKTDTMLKNEAHLSVSGELRKAEYYVDRLMFVYNSSSEILNALAAKIKTLQDSAKNII